MELIYLVYMKIGFFDSGVGGITVLSDALEVCPPLHYIYFADTQNVPYGTKSQKKIKKLVSDATNFLIDKKIDILILACNTATSTYVESLRKKHSIPIIGMEPAVKPAVELSSHKKILVCATRQTLKQKKLNDLILNLGASDKVVPLSLQKLVVFAEKNKWSSKKVHTYLKKKLKDIEWDKFQAVVLGCTHFLYYKEVLRKYIPDDVKIIDGNQGTVNRLLYFLEKMRAKPAEKIKITYYQSKKKAKVKTLKKYMKIYAAQKT